MEPKSKPRRRSELGLLLVGSVVVIAAFILESLATLDRWPPHLLPFVGTTIGLCIFFNVVNRRLVPNADPVIVPVVLLLNGLGWVMLSRLAPYVGANHLAGYQSLWTVLGALGYLFTLLVVRRSRDLERYRYLTLLFAILLLVTPLVPHLGDNIANSNGAKLWVKLGPITFQPVELSKILLVVFFASYFVEKQELLSMATKRVGNRLVPDLRPFGPIALAGACSIAIILVERDIGFSVLLFFMFLSLIWVTTGRWTYLVIGIVAFVAGTYVAAQVLHQLNQRIEIWIDPWKYASGIGYQPIIGELSLAKGGLSGTGLGLGTPQYIPVAISDFIFAAFGEEMGLIGAAAIIVGFMLVVGAGIRASLRAKSEFSKLCALGLTAILGFQAFFIMGGVARLVPLTGVTLPFVSYGGSSLVANYLLIAVLMRISDEGSQPIAAYSNPLPVTAVLARV